MKISFATLYNANDIHNWAGTNFYMGKSLREAADEYEVVDNLQKNVGVWVRAKSKFYPKIFGKQFDYHRQPEVCQNYANQIEAKVSQNSDAIISSSTLPLALVKTKIPRIVWTDATFNAIIGYYPEFMNLCDETIRNGHLMEKTALENSTFAVYSSDWAAENAINFYGIPKEKVKVIAFGANIECHRTAADIENIIKNKDQKVCKLLFIGTDWQRKGGEKALKIAQKLNEMGIPTTLSLVGCQPPIDLAAFSFVKSLGFISKYTEDGKKQLDNLFAESHFFILPTVADCTPMVLAESNSFGVPCITSDVGGLPSIIKNELNGKTFSLDSSAEMSANFIAEVFQNKKRYAEFCRTAFAEYQNRLNWQSAIGSIKELILAAK